MNLNATNRQFNQPLTAFSNAC